MGTPDSITMAMAGQLEVTPPELQFAVKVGEYSKRQMRLNNLGNAPMAYKIKTTNPKEYFVRPNQGVVLPKERAIIQVMMGKLSQLPKEKCKDKFLVQSCQYEGKVPEGDKFDWKKEVTEKTPNADISECRLRCVFQLSDDKESTPQGDTPKQPLPMRERVKPPVDPLIGGSNILPEKKPDRQPTVKPMHSYSMYLIVAAMFFLVGRFTHHLEIPGLQSVRQVDVSNNIHK